MNNIQKAFKTKSKLRGMADGGQVDPRVLGSGMAQRAGSALQGRRAQLDAAIDAASGDPPPPAPVPATAAPAKKPEEKSALRSFFGLADGGQIFKNDVGGVPTFTDAKAATAGAKAYTPGSGGGTFSVVGMEPAQKQQMADAAAQRKAAAAAPTTLGGRLDAALGKLSSPLATAGAPSSTPTLGSELDAAIGRTKGVTSPQTPATGAPANDVNRIMNSRDMSTFSPREKASFNAMTSNANSIAAQNVETGLSASRTPGIPTDTVFPSQLQQDYQDFFGLADGGKVKGKGGPTDDEVGPVMLSHGEYVLPADTVDIVGRDKLDALRLATHDFVDDDNKPKTSSLRKMANGGIVVEELTDPASRRAFAQARAAINAGNPYGAQTVLNDTIPRASAAPAAAKAAAPAAAEAAAPAAANALIPATAAYDAFTDSPEARNRAASGQEGVAGAASKLGSYLGSALTFRTSSPQDIGAMTSALRGEGTGAYHAVPDAEKGWARRLGDRYLPTESAKIMAGGVQLPPAMQARVDTLKRNGIDASNMTGDDFTRARGLAEAASPGAPSHTSLNDAMGALRRGGEPGGGFAQTNVPGIFGRKSSDPKNDLGEYIGVGTPSPQEDPIMGEIRSALRGLTDGAGNRGGGGAWVGGGNSRDINERYDKLAKQLSGMYSRKGQGNLARRLLELEQSRSNALDADARNQSALRGQDMQASTAANNASMQARMQALQTLGTMASQRNSATAAAAKAADDDRKANEGREKEGVADLVAFSRNMFGKDDPRAAEFQRYIVQTNPDILSMGGKERNFAMTEAYAQFLGEGPIRERAKELGTPISQGRNALSPGVVDVTLGDVWNGRAKLGDWRPWSTDNYQMVDSEGNPVLKVPADEYIRNRDGSRNADLINDLARRSALRSKNGE